MTCLTDKKFKSHCPSVTPFSRVFVRFPMQVILAGEAAIPTAMGPKMKGQKQKTLRYFNMGVRPSRLNFCYALMAISRTFGGLMAISGTFGGITSEASVAAMTFSTVTPGARSFNTSP